MLLVKTNSGLVFLNDSSIDYANFIEESKRSLKIYISGREEPLEIDDEQAPTVIMYLVQHRGWTTGWVVLDPSDPNSGGLLADQIIASINLERVTHAEVAGRGSSVVTKMHFAGRRKPLTVIERKVKKDEGGKTPLMLALFKFIPYGQEDLLDTIDEVSLSVSNLRDMAEDLADNVNDALWGAM